MLVLGNVAGYALSGVFLKIWVDFDRVNTGNAFAIKEIFIKLFN